MSPSAGVLLRQAFERPWLPLRKRRVVDHCAVRGPAAERPVRFCGGQVEPSVEAPPPNPPLLRRRARPGACPPNAATWVAEGPSRMSQLLPR